MSAVIVNPFREMPLVGRILLIAKLSRSTSADADSLLAYARRGLGSDSLTLALSVYDITRAVHPVRYNAPTCAAAYALGRLKATEQLAALWRECPRTDHDLRGEVAFAMTLAQSPALVPLIEEYVRSEWNERAGSVDYVNTITARTGRVITRVDFERIDVRYRSRAISSAVLGGSPARIMAMANDRALSPWLRLWCINGVGWYKAELHEFVPAVRRTLDTIAAGAPADSAFRRGIDDCRLMLDIADKVYREHVAPKQGFAWK